MTVPPDVLDAVARGGATDAGGLPVELLGSYLAEVVDAVAAATPIPATRLRSYRALGSRAARDGVALRALLDLYLSAAWRLWRHLPAVRDARTDPDAVVVAGEVLLHAVDDVVAALTEGYQLARRSLARSHESQRREFVDDLLGGAADVVGLLRRADGFGLDLAGPHAVAVVTADKGFDDGQPVVGTLERAILGTKGDAHALLASKDERLVVVFAAPDRAAIDHVVGQLGRTLGKARSARSAVGVWQIWVGRARPGADGVASSYREALEALDVARRLGRQGSVVDSADLLVYQLLLRDRDALVDIVETTLAPLIRARGGAAPLVATLDAWFAAGGNTAAAARALHLSVRAMSYRLARIRELTGLDADRADDRFRLQAAALGARLLDWTAPITMLP
jgi:sugar diacid utilization regulator